MLDSRFVGISMIRVLVGSALPLVGLGVAAALFGSDLVSAPRGEPIIMASSGQATLQPATFDGNVCPSTLLFAGSADRGATAFAGTHILAFALQSGERNVVVGIEDFPGGEGKAPKAVVLVFDAEGHLVAAGDPASLHVQADVKLAAGCAGLPDADLRNPV
jgi:hypothetical protein